MDEARNGGGVEVICVGLGIEEGCEKTVGGYVDVDVVVPAAGLLVDGGALLGGEVLQDVDWGTAALALPVRLRYVYPIFVNSPH